MSFPNPAAAPFHPQHRGLVQPCYYVSGRIPRPHSNDDWNISSILLDSGAGSNFVSEEVARILGLHRYDCPVQRFVIGNGQSIFVDSFVTFPLYIGGVYRPDFTAYIKPSTKGEMKIILGMPGWNAFSIGLKLTGWPKVEMVATVAEHIAGELEKRYVVPNVGNVPLIITIVVNLPSVAKLPGVATLMNGARDKGQKLEDSRRERLLEHAKFCYQAVTVHAQPGQARKGAVLDEIEAAVEEVQKGLKVSENAVMRFLKSEQEAYKLIRGD